MRRNRILNAIALLGAVCFTTGCSGSGAAETAALTGKADKDLLLAELENGIEMNGKKYSIPFTLEDLGVEYYTTGADTEYDVYYKDEYFAYVTIGESDDYLKSCVKSITCAADTDFRLGELYCGNKKDNVIALYGEADMKSPSGLLEHYIFDNGVVLGIEYDNDRIVSLGIEFSNLTSPAPAAFEKEFEITDWTMSELISDFILCGEKICIPCSVDQLGDNYSGTYINNPLIYDNKKIGYIYNTKQKSQSEDPVIRQIVLGGLNDASMPKFSIKTISETSTKYEVEAILGVPNVDSGDESWARYYFSDNESILFVYDNENSDKIKMITIVYNDKM